LFEIAEDFDAGPIVDQERVTIGADDYIAQVMERVTATYLMLLDRNLQKLVDGTAPRRPQDHALATYTCKRLPEDNHIVWSASTRSVHNLVRAVSAPYPGAFSYLAGERLRVWAAELPKEPKRYAGSVPGRILEVVGGRGSIVATGDGALLLTSIQTDRGPAVRADTVLNSLGQTLGPP
jgi:methionyl-tRNA formyltransferase